MEENGEKPQGPDNRPANNYARYTGVVFQMLAIIGVFAFIGITLDKHFNNQTQWITALCCVIGVCGSIFITVKQLTK